MKEIGPRMNTPANAIKIVPPRLASSQPPDGFRAYGPNENSFPYAALGVCCNDNQYQTHKPDAAVTFVSALRLILTAMGSKLLGANSGWASLVPF